MEAPRSVPPRPKAGEARAQAAAKWPAADAAPGGRPVDPRRVPWLAWCVKHVNETISAAKDAGHLHTTVWISRDVFNGARHVELDLVIDDLLADDYMVTPLYAIDSSDGGFGFGASGGNPVPRGLFIVFPAESGTGAARIPPAALYVPAPSLVPQRARTSSVLTRVVGTPRTQSMPRPAPQAAAPAPPRPSVAAQRRPGRRVPGSGALAWVMRALAPLPSEASGVAPRTNGGRHAGIAAIPAFHGATRAAASASAAAAAASVTSSVHLEALALAALGGRPDHASRAASGRRQPRLTRTRSHDELLPDAPATGRDALTHRAPLAASATVGDGAPPAASLRTQPAWLSEAMAARAASAATAAAAVAAGHALKND
jgi:hypothetical protein